MDKIGGVLGRIVAPLAKRRVGRIDRATSVSAPSDQLRMTTTRSGITFHSYFITAPISSTADGVYALASRFNAVGLYEAHNNPLDDPNYISSNSFHARIAAAAKPAISEIMRIHGLTKEDELWRKYEVHIFCESPSSSNDGRVFYWKRKLM